MAWLLRFAILFTAVLAPTLAEAKTNGQARRLFIAGAATGGAAFGVAAVSAIMATRNDAWRQCVTHCGDPLGRPGNLAIPLGLVSVSLLGTAMAKRGWEDGPSGGGRRDDRISLGVGIPALLLAGAGVASIGRIAETRCARRCHYVSLAATPLAAIATASVMIVSYAIARRVSSRRAARVQPTVAIGRTTTFGFVGRF
jgi:hypothetical protein